METKKCPKEEYPGFGEVLEIRLGSFASIAEGLMALRVHARSEAIDPVATQTLAEVAREFAEDVASAWAAKSVRYVEFSLRCYAVGEEAESITGMRLTCVERTWISETWTSSGEVPDLAGWCKCDRMEKLGGEAYYMHRPSGNHGWFCKSCKRITQTG